jgi:hypothetical protein
MVDDEIRHVPVTSDGAVSARDALARLAERSRGQ